METKEILFESIATLTVHKLRSGLAILGIVIGIGSVIALISLGQSSQKSVETQIQSLGANLLTISPGGQMNGAVRSAAGSSSTLTLEDANAIANTKTISTVSRVSPELSRRQQVTAGKNNTNTSVIGVKSMYAVMRNISLSSGVFIAEKDELAQAKIAVLGSQVATDLFDSSNALGQKIRINGKLFTVVGVAASKGGTGFNNPDDALYVPLSTAQKELFGTNSLSSIAVEATSKDVMDQTRDAVGYLLLARHKITDPTQADFLIFSQNDILQTASQVTGTFTTLLGGIAAISLLVGGIGIMNIMLVTVTERTREIGLRKALGAKRKSIITQFLLEATVLTFVGGVLGMVIGILTSFILASVMSVPFSVSFSSVALAIGVSGIIGIIFGWYPAQIAAKMQPIEALRYE